MDGKGKKIGPSRIFPLRRLDSPISFKGCSYDIFHFCSSFRSGGITVGVRLSLMMMYFLSCQGQAHGFDLRARHACIIRSVS